MRYLFWLWLTPLALFWGWFGLSYYDMNFGLTIFSRQLHELVFNIYGSLLGVEPTAIPMMFLQACIFDTVLVFAIVAFRKRRAIRAWWAGRRHADRPEMAEDRTTPVQAPAE